MKEKATFANVDFFLNLPKIADLQAHKFYQSANLPSVSLVSFCGLIQPHFWLTDMVWIKNKKDNSLSHCRLSLTSHWCTQLNKWDHSSSICSEKRLNHLSVKSAMVSSHKNIEPSLVHKTLAPVSLVYNSQQGPPLNRTNANIIQTYMHVIFTK